MKEICEIQKFNLMLAGNSIGVTCKYYSTKEYCLRYLTDSPEELLVAVSDSDIAEEKRLFPALSSASESEIEKLALFRKIAEALIPNNILVFHGSALSVDGEGFVITALSGTGKSTHAEIWRRVLTERGHKVVMINDDKPLLRFTDGGVFVCGSPWNGKHKLGDNISVKLKAICDLHRAECNRLESVSAEQAFLFLYRQTYKSQNPAKLAKTLELTDRLINSVGLYRLECNTEDEAALRAYSGMNGGIT